MYNRTTKYDDEIDIKDFEKFLKEYYKEENDENLELLLKQDIKLEQSFRKLLEKSGYETREFFTYSTKLYPKIFNKLTIKKIRTYLTYADKR